MSCEKAQFLRLVCCELHSLILILMNTELDTDQTVDQGRYAYKVCRKYIYKSECQLTNDKEGQSFPEIHVCLAKHPDHHILIRGCLQPRLKPDQRDAPKGTSIQAEGKCSE